MARRRLGQTGYWTVIIPYTDVNRTEWHPTQRTGPFSTVSRGAFATRAEADAWARRKLRGTKYRLRFTKPYEAAPFRKFKGSRSASRDPDDRSYRTNIEGLDVTIKYHPRSQLWSATIHAKRGKGTLPGSDGRTAQEAESRTRALLRRSMAKS